MNWKELKDFCNNLPIEELEKKVILWREEECINDISAEQLDSDYFIDPDNDENGCYPENEALEVIRDNPEYYTNGLEDLKKCYSKGHPVLMENF